MTEAEKLKAQTVSLHFKVEELHDRFRILEKFKMVQEAERQEFNAKFADADKTIELIRQMQDHFDKLNFTPFVNSTKKQSLVRQIKRQ